MPEVVLNELVERYPVLGCVKDDIFNAYKLLEACFAKDCTLFTCGNGGSSADAFTCPAGPCYTVKKRNVHISKWRRSP